MSLKLGGFYEHVPRAVLENEDDDGISVVTAHSALKLPDNHMYLVVTWYADSAPPFRLQCLQ